MSMQVNEIYHDQSLGARINVVLVRIIMLGYGKVGGHVREGLYLVAPHWMSARPCTSSALPPKVSSPQATTGARIAMLNCPLYYVISSHGFKSIQGYQKMFFFELNMYTQSEVLPPPSMLTQLVTEIDSFRFRWTGVKGELKAWGSQESVFNVTRLYSSVPELTEC